jgi:hypothetical protein
VVGYVNATYGAGFWLVANPLNAGDGKNTVGMLFGHNDVGYPAPVVPDGCILYKFVNATGAYDINSFDVDQWTDPAMSLAPGDGAFLRIPPGQTAKVTFVGEVLQGNLSNPIPKGFSIKSSQVPQAAVLTKDVNMPADTLDLGFPAADGDIVYKWKNAEKVYGIYAFDVDQWSEPPIIDVAESFFVRKVAATTWTRTFNVQ